MTTEKNETPLAGASRPGSDSQRSRRRIATWLSLLLGVAMCLALAACGGSGGGGGGGGTNPTVTVTISPSSASLAPSGTTQFTATVTGATDQSVTWTASSGTISSTGFYTAPAATGSYTVTATSTASPSASASVTVTVSNSIHVSISPISPVVAFGQQVQFTATVTGSTNTAVIWAASEGSITQAGLFTAPSTIESVTVTCSYAANTAIFAQTTVSVVKTGASVSISPAGATLGIGDTQTFTATVTGATNTTVTWSATGGTITSAGVYTAGNTAGSYTVTATSNADPTKSATATVTVNPIVVTVTPATGQVLIGRSYQFFAKVTGTFNTGVTWSTNFGTITSAGLLTAPGTTGTVTVTATSTDNPSVSGTATVSVVNATDITYTFTNGAASVWSPQTTTTCPNGTQTFLGLFGSTTTTTATADTATLTLTNLSPHSSVLIQFNLYVIGGWIGQTTNGNLAVTTTSTLGTNTIFTGTFSNETGDNQSYPAAGSAPGTSATATNSLGYVYPPTSILYNDATYYISITSPDTATSLTIVWTGTLTDTLANQSWGINNVHIHANP